MQSPAPLRLRLLGGFSATIGGKPVALRAKKARALLAALALSRGKAMTRDKLAALLWGDVGQEQARTSLRQTLAGLRKALGPAGAHLLTGTEEIALSDACDVDACELEQRNRGGIDELRRAAELYQGPVLDGLELREEAFDEWLSLERQRLKRLAANCLRRLNAAERELDNDEAALAAAQELTKLDPLDESAHRQVIELLNRTGRPTEALQWYHELEGTLREALQVEPEPSTKALIEAVSYARQTAPPARPDCAPLRAPERAPRAGDGRPALLVLPFDNLSPDARDDYISDGITEDIIAELSRFPSLFIIARNSAFTFKGKRVELGELRASVGADYVVEGSVRRAGNRVRVSAQLSDTESGQHLWAERYDRELVDVFELQDELTRTIAALLPGRVENFESKRVLRKPPASMQAYELLLAGKIHHHRGTQPDNAKALELLDRALELDPEYAAAMAWKGCVLGQAMAHDWVEDKQASIERTAAIVEQALAIDPNEVECHRILAEVAMARRQFSLARHHNEQALALNCNDPRLVAQRGEWLTWCGDAARGASEIATAMKSDPFTCRTWAHLLGRANLVQEKYAEARDAYRGAPHQRFHICADIAACHAALGEEALARQSAKRTLLLHVRFDPIAYVSGLPYQYEPYRHVHRAALELVAWRG